MSTQPPLIVILGAGKGTRMQSDLPKVLHPIAGCSMLAHVLRLAQSIATAKIAMVVGPGMPAVEAETRRLCPDAQVFVQHTQLGTADAVLAARAAIAAHDGDVFVLYADTPLIRAETLHNLRAALDAGAGVAVLGFEAQDPSGYGRLVTNDAGALIAIREHKDASPAELSIRLCNSGVMAFRITDLLAVLQAIGNANAKGEFYLTDAVEIVLARGGRCSVVVCPEEEVLGVNSRTQLANAERIWQQRARVRVMENGATLTAPETVWFSFDTVIGRDVSIEPHVVFGPGVVVDDGAEIKAFCHIEGARIGRSARVGPFARLRPGADLGPDVHVGNFVEVKNVSVGAGAKANHLAYLGDGSVGARANIGAGTIFCNYDGFFKHRTEVGAEAFVGSNSSLVAPVRIGAGAMSVRGASSPRMSHRARWPWSAALRRERAGWRKSSAR